MFQNLVFENTKLVLQTELFSSEKKQPRYEYLKFGIQGPFTHGNFPQVEDKMPLLYLGASTWYHALSEIGLWYTQDFSF